ncbi:hypothetical protein HWV62_8921 [Athelia sp. TMB]|nr:hypothetical protein HWV62_8921 [Athelia sp. TMB]
MIAATAIFVYEWMLCVDDEVEIGMRKGMNVPIITYFLARLTTLLHIFTSTTILMSTIQPAAPPDGWGVSVGMVSFIAWWFCGALTSLLFFFRVLAVFNDSCAKKVIFSVLWGLTVCATIPLVYTVAVPALPASVCRLYIEGSHPIVFITSCPERPVLAMILLILMATHHILVFISISHELLSNNTHAGAGYMRTLFTGNGLLPVSKSLLRSGQLYVSVSVGLVFATILIYWEAGGWWMLWSAIHPAAECILSCRVFRTLLLSEPKLGESIELIRTKDVEEMVMAAIDRVNNRERC